MLFADSPYWKTNPDWYVKENPGDSVYKTKMKDSAPEKAKRSFEEWKKYCIASDRGKEFEVKIDWDVVFGREKMNNSDASNNRR